MAGVSTFANLVSIGEQAVRAAKVVSELRKSGHTPAAMALESECNRMVRAIIRTTARRRAASKRAQKAGRSSGGRFN